MADDIFKNGLSDYRDVENGFYNFNPRCSIPETCPLICIEMASYFAEVPVALKGIA